MNYYVLNSFAINCTAQLLGFDNFIPPFAVTSGDQLLGGANFASAAAGIRAETGQQLVCMLANPMREIEKERINKATTTN
jgi:hypothetical protein